MPRYEERKEKVHARGAKGIVTGHDEGIGRGNHANMPTEVMMKDYPRCSTYGSSEYDDTMTNIDDVNQDSVKTARKHMSFQK